MQPLLKLKNYFLAHPYGKQCENDQRDQKATIR